MGEQDLPTENEYERHRMLVNGGYQSDEAVSQYVETRGRAVASEALPKKDSSWFDKRYATADMFSKWYEMNPETEDLLFDGNELAEGMVVLVEDPNRRIDIEGSMTPEHFYEARKWNRWFMISRLDRTPNGMRLSFLGTYEDGTKFKFDDVNKNHGWLCKHGVNVFGQIAMDKVDEIPPAQFARQYENEHYPAPLVQSTPWESFKPNGE